MKPIAALAAPAALFLAMFAAPTLAHADTLTVTSGYCDQTTGGAYYAQFECEFAWTGATGQATVQFIGNAHGGINNFTYGGDTEVSANGTCEVGQLASITATVTDSVSSASRTTYITCQHDAP